MKTTRAIFLLLTAVVAAAPLAAAARGGWFEEADTLAAVVYRQGDDAISFDTTGALPPQVKVVNPDGTSGVIRFELDNVGMTPATYAMTPADGVVESIQLEANKDRGRAWVTVTVATAEPFKYDLERRQMEGGVSSVVLHLRDVKTKRVQPDKGDRVPLYARAAADASVVSYITYHTQVEVLDYAKEMYLVKAADGTLGWVREANVKIAGDNPFKKEGPAPADDLRHAVIASAKKYLGVPYVWGGTSAKGFDCSGLVQTVFGENGVALPRGSGDQFREGKKVSRDRMQPGDLVFFHTYTSGPSHVGIYVGDGKFLHAESSPAGVTITPLDAPYWRDRFHGARTWLTGE